MFSKKKISGYSSWHVHCFFFFLFSRHDSVSAPPAKARSWVVFCLFVLFCFFSVVFWSNPMSCRDFLKWYRTVFKSVQSNSVWKNVHSSMKNTTVECHSPVFSTHSLFKNTYLHAHGTLDVISIWPTMSEKLRTAVFFCFFFIISIKPCWYPAGPRVNPPRYSMCSWRESQIDHSYKSICTESKLILWKKTNYLCVQKASPRFLKQGARKWCKGGLGREGFGGEEQFSHWNAHLWLFSLSDSVCNK